MQYVSLLSVILAVTTCGVANSKSVDLETELGALLQDVEREKACRPLKPEVQCAREDREGFYPDRCDPARFYQCVWTGEMWTGVSMPCAPGTVWKQSRKACVHAPPVHEVQSSSQHVDEEAQRNEMVGAEHEEKPCKPRDPQVVCPRLGARRAYYADRCDVAMYYQCQLVGDLWTAHHMPCAPGTVWSQPTRACVHPETEAQVPEVYMSDPDVDNEGKACKPIVSPNVACVTIGRRGYYPHRCSEAMYHQCQWTGSGWVAHARACAPGTVWRQMALTCVHSKIESASLVAPPGGDTCEPGNPEVMCDVSRYYGDSCDPARFFQCQHTGDGWAAFPVACAPGTAWHMPQKSCVHLGEEGEQVEQGGVVHTDITRAGNQIEDAGEKYTREVLHAVSSAIHGINKRYGWADTVISGRTLGGGAEEKARRPDRARGENQATNSRGVWDEQQVAEDREGAQRSTHSTSGEDTCEISGVSDDGQQWSHAKRSVPGEREKYVLVLPGGTDLVMSCAYGTAFSLETCDCTVRMIPKAEEGHFGAFIER